MAMSNTNKQPLDFLTCMPLFNDLNPATLEAISEMAEHKSYFKHAHIYKVGHPSQNLYFLVRGVVKIGTHFDDGREVIKQILHPMAMFGELGLVGETERREFATAMNEEVQVYAVPVESLKNMLRKDSDLSMRFINMIGERLRRTEGRLESLIFKDARERIIDFLKDSANRQGKKVGYEMLIRHCLTQQDIANITGTSRQTVTSVLNELRKANLIYFNRRSILIRDMGKLS